MRNYVMAVMFLFMIPLVSKADDMRTPASSEGKIESKHNGREKSYDYDKYTVVPKEATDAYKAKMARLEQLEEENARLKKQLAEQGPPAQAESYKNSVSLIGGANTSGLKTDSSPSTFTVKNGYETDLGAMYQRDFNRIRGSVGATLRGNLFLGVGLNF